MAISSYLKRNTAMEMFVILDVQHVLEEGAELLPKPFDAPSLKRIVVDGEPAMKADSLKI